MVLQKGNIFVHSVQEESKVWVIVLWLRLMTPIYGLASSDEKHYRQYTICTYPRKHFDQEPIS